jgi:glycogen debranching enzyme
MASLLRIFGDSERADQLKKDAARLAKRLDQAYWVRGRGFYAMAVDSNKNLVDMVSSNPGHLWFSRVVGRERTGVMIERMMRDEMFSGWGWRTLSDQETSFNALSYHRGSVWPHDNSLIAYGMARCASRLRT